jgi:hypothetical protein
VSHCTQIHYNEQVRRMEGQPVDFVLVARRLQRFVSPSPVSQGKTDETGRKKLDGTRREKRMGTESLRHEAALDE